MTDKGNNFSVSREIRGGCVCYRIGWSPFIRMDRYLVHAVIPSESGVFQVFRNTGGRLEMLMMDKAYYGGVRNRIRELIDPLYHGFNPYKKEILDSECYVRYSLVSSHGDMEDILHFFTDQTPSGRFESVMVDERETLEIRKD